MKENLKLRCFIKKVDYGYAAVCIDLNLAAQGATLREAKEKLESMIVTYVHEALTVHAQYQDQLLNRKSPLSLRAEYYFAFLLCKAEPVFRRFPKPLWSWLAPLVKWLPKSFIEPMPPGHAV